MSRINCYSVLAAVGLALCAGFTSCKDDDLASDDHYKIPDWLKGNAYEVLQSEPEYSTFLKAVELSDYKGIVAGKSILTVVAPDNDAFKAFLSEKGYSSIEDLDRADHTYLNKLVGYHLMYFAFDWDKMVNYRPDYGDSATDEEKQSGAGFYYKHRTHSSDPVEEVRVKLTANAEKDTLVHVYHYERYLPVFSNKMFETKGIDAAYNYNYFYPDTKWAATNHSGDCFNIAGANVKDLKNVITDNGYLYHVDKVIEPLNTIYEELSKNSKYSKYLELYNKYTKYAEVPSDVTSTLGFNAFIHGFDGVPGIACEWPVSSFSAAAILNLERVGYNLFAPTNTAIDNFFNSFWKGTCGYEKVEDLDQKILEYFIYQTFSQDALLVFPDEIKKGDVLTQYNTPINIDVDQVTDRKICCNGAVYGMDRMELPAIFSCVVGPAFQDTTYRSYLYALDKNRVLEAMASNETSFVTLMPSNIQLYNSVPSVRIWPDQTGFQIQSWNEDVKAYTEMMSSACKYLSDMHIAQNVKELKTSGLQVIATQASYNYWFVKDGRITTNSLFNQQLTVGYQGDPFVDFHPILNDGKSWSNGSSYSYDSDVAFAQAGSEENLGARFSTGNNNKLPYYVFAQLMQKSGLVENGSIHAAILPPNSETKFVVFVPTNDVLTQALADKVIPGATGLYVDVDGDVKGSVADKKALQNFLQNYFMNSALNTFLDYPYLGSVCKGEFFSTGSKRLFIEDTGSSLKVGFSDSTAPRVNVTSDYGFLPFAFADGCLHFIDGLLQ